MLTNAAIKNANKALEKVDIKGKGYVLVTERIKAFRDICPNGCITTEILSLEDGVVTMKATITDDEGHILATGLAQEKESNGYINKTSFIENCETSAVGRALGMLGIGIDASMASAEEVANAMLNQSAGKETIGETKAKALADKLAKDGVSLDKVFELYKVKALKDLTEKQHSHILANIDKLKESK